MGITYRECTDLPLIIVRGSPGNSHTSPVKNHCMKAKYKNSDLVTESYFQQSVTVTAVAPSQAAAIRLYEKSRYLY